MLSNRNAMSAAAGDRPAPAVGAALDQSKAASPQAKEEKEDLEPSSDGSAPKPGEDKWGGVRVFRPTWEEFRDFSAFVAKIEPLCTAGICKVGFHGASARTPF